MGCFTVVLDCYDVQWEGDKVKRGACHDEKLIMRYFSVNLDGKKEDKGCTYCVV